MTGRHRRDDESDDPHVAESRAAADDDGSYVGSQTSDDDIDAGVTGAEARSSDGR